MANTRVASRYAKSLLGLAIEKNILDEVYQDMVLFKEISQKNHDFVLMLRNPIISHDKKKAILFNVFQGRVTDSTLAIFDIITRKNREAYLPAIAESFEIQYRQQKGIEKATVITATSLTPELRDQISKFATRRTNKTIELEEKVDPSIIGGYIIVIGDQQIDNSVRTKLRDMSYEFSETSYIKAY